MTKVIIIKILLPFQNINKSESKNIDVFGSKFGPDTFTFIDQFLFIFWDGVSTSSGLFYKQIYLFAHLLRSYFFVLVLCENSTTILKMTL
jgi:hypothetical protein